MSTFLCSTALCRAALFRAGLACLISLTSFSSFAAALSSHESLALDLFRELVETDTTASQGDTSIAARKMADRLLKAGFPAADVTVIDQAPRKGNLVARLRSPNPTKGPILLLAHIDVVEADPADWSIDPFILHDKDDYFYGRGTLDDKNEAAIHIANLITMYQQGYQPNRDIIVALTADEEGGPDNGADYLLTHHRALVQADLVINEGGGGVLQDGQYLANTVQSAEKIYQSYTLEITDSGGHSSRPKAFNPIYDLATALTHIARYKFPAQLNETTRAYFTEGINTRPEAQAQMVRGLLETPMNPASVAYFDTRPAIGALLRTTCVATMLAAGHAENALPQRATATVNCRILPGTDPADIQADLTRLINNDKISITPAMIAKTSDPSPLTDEVMFPIRNISQAMWPGVAVIPSMSTGATDALFFRNAGMPVYGVSGIFVAADDNRAHGRDERVLKQSFFEGLAFLDQLTRALTSSQDTSNPPTPL